MRILMVSKALPPTFVGGIQTHVCQLSQALLKRGHQVSILTAGSLRKGTTIRMENGIQIIEIPHLSYYYIFLLPHSISEFSFNVAAVRWIEKNAHHFDVVHTHGRSGYHYPSLKRRKLPVVVSIHRLYSEEISWSKNEYKNCLDRMLHLYLASRYELKSVHCADAVIAISKEVVRELHTMQVPKEKIHLIYNGIDIHIPVELNKPSGNQILFVGRLCEIKGIYPLIESMIYVRPDIHLKMLGDGAEREKLQKRIFELGLLHRIEIVGKQPIEEVFRQLEQSYALILPSHHESQGIVLMEANLAGKPTLGSDVPGIDEMIIPGKNGYLFPVNNPQAIAQAINNLFEHPAEAARLGKWGRKWVQAHFSWEKIAEKIEDLYELVTLKNQKHLA